MYPCNYVFGQDLHKITVFPLKSQLLIEYQAYIPVGHFGRSKRCVFEYFRIVNRFFIHIENTRKQLSIYVHASVICTCQCASSNAKF